MTGDIGSLVSNEGITVRAGAELNPGSTFRYGIEAGMDRYNQNRQFSQIPCDHSGGRDRHLAESPVSIGLEARMTPLRYGHEGKHTISWSPSLVLSVSW